MLDIKPASQSTSVAETLRRKSRFGALRKKFGMFFAALAVIIGIGVGVAAPSQAATVNCYNGQCTAKLNWTETVNLSNYQVPRISTPIPVLTAALYAGLAGHVLIAKLWVRQNTCVGFTVNIRPWATQGMFGWRCR